MTATVKSRSSIKKVKRSTPVQKNGRAQKLADEAKRQVEIIHLLRHYYASAKCSLDYRNPFELLVATILSAQCTDVRVNKVTPGLFARYPDPKSLAGAELGELEDLIRSTGFYKNKAKNLKACGNELIKKFGGDLPRSVEALSSLAGVGRKTANVVLGNAFGIPAMVVDTHVMRLSNRLGFVKSKIPEKIELRLQEIVPQEHWVFFSHWLIQHGREVCVARTPKCEKCFLEQYCPKKSYSKND